MRSKGSTTGVPDHFFFFAFFLRNNGHLLKVVTGDNEFHIQIVKFRFRLIYYADGLTPQMN